ncbi:cell wall hydrolase [Neobacillus sp. PS3-40]|uniref:cell wall hydrolase n=1 Tax=Neobacillus sp. PS3-40 TaxID=3070679 RepID=UPI0027E154EF|nr:cell wall hydrolase [Neobacillus sp. PS3-40]WML43474.1 cell wall hydrolase [Neobacillus sp. PS3-40]
MKRFAYFLIVIVFLNVLIHPGPTHHVSAKTLDSTKIYKVNKGDTFYQIAVKFGVSKIELKKWNEGQDYVLTPGKKIIIPKQVPKQDKELLARLVTAEAKGEPFAGKVAVATVVLNRVDSNEFPDTIHDVIYEKQQFEPVQNGMINKPAGDEAKKAVNEAIAKKGNITDALYFYNPDLTDNKWLKAKKTTEVIGNHRFAI